MKRTARAVVALAAVIGALALTGCSISIDSTAQGSSPASVGPVAVTSPAAPASPSAKAAGASPSTTAAGATYVALVAPVNAATFALDTAVFGSTADLTAESLRAIVAASAASLRTFDDHLRSVTWPRTAEPDITTLASANDVLVEVLKGYESDLQSPTAADFNAVLQNLQVDGSGYAVDLGRATDAAARVRADLGLPPASAPQVTLND